MIHHDITTWTDWELDNANYPYQPEWMSSTLNPANFQGVRGEYGGYFSGGRYSFEFVTPPVVYETVQAAINPPSTPPSTVPDYGPTVLLALMPLTLLAILKRYNK
jgi:hypothetical protein